MKIYLKYILFVLAINTLIYATSVKNFFVSDDFDWLHLTKFGDPLWQAFVGNYYGHHGVGGAFRPMVNIFFELGHLLGSSSLAYHVMQFLIHAGVVLLVGLLARELMTGKYQNHAMYLSALLFSIMPFHTEAVVWISAIGDPLATLFFLLALYIYIQWRQKTGPVLFFGSVIALGLSLLTKEIGIVFPLLLIAYELCIAQNYKLLAILRAVWIHSLLVVGYLLYRNWAIGVLAGYYAESNLHVNLLGYAHNFGVYLITLFVSDHIRLQVIEALDSISTYVISGGSVLILLTLFVAGIIMLARKFASRSIFFLSFVVLNLALVSPLAMSSLNDEGERYVYIASVGFAWLIAMIIIALWKRQKIVASVITIAIISCWGFVSLSKLNYWHKASKLSQGMYEQLGDINFSAYKKVFFVGMPETFEGAQVMRNGLTQAIEWKSNNQIHNTERIPVYQVLNYENAWADLYDTKEVRSNGVHFTTKNNAFTVTGDAAKAFGEYKFELWNYLYTKPLANTIHLEFSGGREYDWARDEIGLYYYDQGELKLVIRN